MAHDTLYNGQPVMFHVRNESDMQRVRKIRRDVEAMLPLDPKSYIQETVVGNTVTLRIAQ